MSGQAAHAGDFGQVNAEDAIQLRAQIETWFIAPGFVMVFGLGQRLLVVGKIVGKNSQLSLDLDVTSSNPLLMLALGS